MFGPKLVIGAVHGYAVGGGLEWLLNCDLVVAADDLVAFFPEMQLGHFVTGGVTHLLPQAVGHQRAMELFVLGERQDAQALHRLGLVNLRWCRAPGCCPPPWPWPGRWQSAPPSPRRGSSGC